MNGHLRGVVPTIIVFSFLAVAGCGTTTTFSSTKSSPSNVSKQTQSKVSQSSSSISSLQRQVQLLQQAVLPGSPIEAAKTWARAIQTRNGALQYAILTPQLQRKMKEGYESWNWSPGPSSPWVKSFTVGPGKQTGKHQCQFTIVYTLSDSTHNTKNSMASIVVSEFNHHWYVSNTMGYGS